MSWKPSPADGRFLYSGLVRLHVLHHAAQAPVFGAAMMEELTRHGYRLSAGTLYPVLHALEKRGLLASRIQRAGNSRRRIYRATAKGRQALGAAIAQVHELFHELVEESATRRA